MSPEGAPRSCSCRFLRRGGGKGAAVPLAQQPHITGAYAACTRCAPRATGCGTLEWLLLKWCKPHELVALSQGQLLLLGVTHRL